MRQTNQSSPTPLISVSPQPTAVSANGSNHFVGLAGQRSNGLAADAPRPDQTILVAGGAGYIGSVLVPRCWRAATAYACSTACTSARAAGGVRDQIELVVRRRARRPIRGAFDGVDGVINLSGLSNDPTAEFNPEANWQMNAIATETLGKLACLERGIERYVFASSCSLYDGLPPGMHAEDADIQPRAAYATSKRYGEERTDRAGRRGAVPRDAAQRHRLRLEPEDALRPGGEHLRQGRPAGRALKLHGGGWMWRPLVDIQDCADAMIAAYEAPAEKVAGEIFNVVHSNYQIRELAMIVAGSVQLTGREWHSRRSPRPSSRATTSAPTPSCRRRWASSPAARCSRPSATCSAQIDPEDPRPDRPALLQHPLAGAAGSSDVKPVLDAVPSEVL
jgi:nucleoside-diphosphate-sugar epimerase